MVEDPIKKGLAGGWQVIDSATLGRDSVVEADVAIIGTGAGGGVTAEILTQAGLKVVLLEEGPLKSSSDFRMSEPEAYASLYQEGGTRKTKDNAIFVFQGRAVGGSTTINWTSSFRTPDRTLKHWSDEFGLNELTPAQMAPWFEGMEKRLSMAPWGMPPNSNNNLLKAGGDKLGIATGIVPRNVAGCWNLGYCGLGCPTNAKQSMLVTTIPAALNGGATLYHRLRVDRLVFTGDRVTAAEGSALDARTRQATGRKLSIRARHFVVAGGGINSPALLIRSGTPDPYQTLGKRTFLHPVSVSMAMMPETVNGFHGAPQSVHSDHFVFDDLAGPIGYKLEAAAVHPIFAASTLALGYGQSTGEEMARLPYMQSLIALLRDGFHPESAGGQVEVRADGSPVLDYPISDYVWAGLRQSLLTMAEIQFAAGARSVKPSHLDARAYTSWAEAREEIARLPTRIIRFIVGSAHIMGGCGMSADPRFGVVNGDGRHHQIGNLSVLDGSVFPTSVGANPQLSIYGLTARNASRLSESLRSRP